MFRVLQCFFSVFRQYELRLYLFQMLWRSVSANRLLLFWGVLLQGFLRLAAPHLYATVKWISSPRRQSQNSLERQSAERSRVLACDNRPLHPCIAYDGSAFALERVVSCNLGS